MTRKIFVNLPVRNLEKSKAFFAALGFEFNPMFTDDNAACMIISEEASVMLLTASFFKTFTNKELCDTTKQTEGLFCLSCSSREEVDHLVKMAIESGGKAAMPKMEQGPMYGWSFYDVDDHHWEVLHMDMAALQKQA